MVFNWEGYKRAIENELTIINKDKAEVPFILNKAQDHLIQHITEKNVILKARKMGFSSVLLAIGTMKFLMGVNERCVSMSFDSDASSKQLERAKRFIKSFERNNQTKIPMKYNSKNEMVYERLDEEGNTIQNTFRIGTAKSDSFGRGDDITFLHLTEVSQADHLEDLLAGVGEAVVNNSITTLETTANGFNEFKTFWDDAVFGTRGYTTLFYGPEWEYTSEFLEEKKKNLKDKYPQEYPSSAEEAFLTSGASFFDVMALKRHLERVREPMQLNAIY